MSPDTQNIKQSAMHLLCDLMEEIPPDGTISGLICIRAKLDCISLTDDSQDIINPNRCCILRLSSMLAFANDLLFPRLNLVAN